MTDQEKELQRRSFAYGNAAIENPLVTRAIVDEQAMSSDNTAAAGMTAERLAEIIARQNDDDSAGDELFTQGDGKLARRHRRELLAEVKRQAARIAELEGESAKRLGVIESANKSCKRRDERIADLTRQLETARAADFKGRIGCEQTRSNRLRRCSHR